MGPGPAGIAQLEYLFSRIVCISVPLGFTVLLVILVIAGIKYLISAGEPKAVTSAHQTVTWGLLGIVFLALAWLILQLIQNFTGVEVTKFTLSSLPGVQGFTGSCWSEPPVSKEVSSAVKPSNKKNNTASSNTPIIQTEVKAECRDLTGFDFPSSICTIPCGYQDEDFLEPANSPFENLPLMSSLAYKVTDYNYSDLTKQLEVTIEQPIPVNLLADSTSDQLWQIKPQIFGGYDWTINWNKPILEQTLDYYVLGKYFIAYPKEYYDLFGENYLQRVFGNNTSYWAGLGVHYQFLTSKNQNNYWEGDYYGRFKKDTIPTTLIHAMYQAQQLAKNFINNNPQRRAGVGVTAGAIESDLKKLDRTLDRVDLIGLSCSDGDYYNITTASPLIYFYPTKPTAVKTTINSPITSKVKDWSFIADSKGEISLKDGRKLNFIPYEFLRRDFRRPTQGFVVDKEHYISFLKDNLWKSLGLTGTEIADYWKDLEWRIPKSEYYFISLIDRTEIDRVLPMEVNPKPDTIIRNMTYILPLQQPFIPIPLPEIKAPERKGFTVLENGGFIDEF